jgi:hypothetical protein
MNMNTAPGFKEILSHAETEYQAMIRQFAVKSTELTTRFFHLFGVEEVVRTLKTLAIQDKWKSLASHHTALTHSVVDTLNLPALWTDSGYPPKNLKKWTLP